MVAISTSGFEVGSGGFINSVRGTITTAQIATLNTSPVQLVAAAGSGTIIKPLSFKVRFNFGTAAISGASTMYLIYSGVTGYALCYNIPPQIMTGSSSAQDAYMDPLCSVAGNNGTMSAINPYSSTGNRGISLWMTSGNPSVGSSTGTLTWSLLYEIVPL